MERTTNILDGFIIEIDDEKKTWISLRRIFSAFANYEELIKNVDALLESLTEGEDYKNIYQDQELIDYSIRLNFAQMIVEMLINVMRKKWGETLFYTETGRHGLNATTKVQGVIEGLLVAENFTTK